METGMDPIQVGRRLADARRAAGITQEQAAAHLECSRPTLIAIEKGTRPANPGEIVSLAALYGRTVHEIVRPGEPSLPLTAHLRAAIESLPRSKQALEQALDELVRFVDDYRELERLVEAPIPRDYPPEVTLPAKGDVVDFAEDAAAQERARLRLGDQPVQELRRMLESHVGLRIFFGALPPQIAGMYAYVADLGYCILINRKHPAERRRWSLAHEYGHFLVDRHRPGVDELDPSGRRAPNERFADAFARGFLMPRTGVRSQYRSILSSSRQFTVADLCRLADYFTVSVQAMALRLEELGLIPRGTWEHLREEGFKPSAAKDLLDLSKHQREEQPYPERYKVLAVQAYRSGLLSEGLLARYLRTDRVGARIIVDECTRRTETDAQGSQGVLIVPLDEPLVSER